MPGKKKKVTRVTSHHLYYSMCSKCPTPARTQAHIDAAEATFNNRVTQTVPLVAAFQFVDVQDFGTIDSLLINVK